MKSFFKHSFKSNSKRFFDRKIQNASPIMNLLKFYDKDFQRHSKMDFSKRISKRFFENGFANDVRMSCQMYPISIFR
jgi:hypothetical protein